MVKIVAVETDVIEQPVKHQFVWRKGLPGSGTQTIETKLTIYAEEGVKGHTFAARGPIVFDLKTASSTCLSNQRMCVAVQSSTSD
jgi:hypothetical protein